MTITVKELIEQLSVLDLELPVYACHGASGVSDEVGSAQLATVSEWDDGALLELEEGTKYVSLYTGN